MYQGFSFKDLGVESRQSSELYLGALTVTCNVLVTRIYKDHPPLSVCPSLVIDGKIDGPIANKP